MSGTFRKNIVLRSAEGFFGAVCTVQVIPYREKRRFCHLCVICMVRPPSYYLRGTSGTPQKKKNFFFFFDFFLLRPYPLGSALTRIVCSGKCLLALQACVFTSAKNFCSSTVLVKAVWLPFGFNLRVLTF